jgi:hypothetical protein
MHKSVIVPLFISILVIMIIPSWSAKSFASNLTSELHTAMYGLHRYMVYTNVTANGKTDIFFQESHNNGTSFSHPIDLNNYLNKTTPLVSPNENPQVGAFHDEVYVIWQGQISGGNKNLFYIKSSDGGQTFGNATDVSQNKAVDVLESKLIVDSITGFVFVGYLNADGSVVACHVHCED